MYHSRVIAQAAAIIAMAMPASLWAQFVDSGTVSGTQTLGNQGNVGLEGSPGPHGGTGDIGDKGVGGMGGHGGLFLYDFFCFSTGGIAARTGESGHRGGTGGGGGRGGQGGDGGFGGLGGTATWSFASGSSFVNSSVIFLGGAQGADGDMGIEGSIGSSGSTDSEGFSGGRGGNGGGILLPTFGVPGGGASPGFGGRPCPLLDCRGRNGGDGASPSGGGGGGGGSGACLLGAAREGGNGGDGFGRSGNPGNTGSHGLPGPSRGPVGAVAPISLTTIGSLTNKGALTIGGKGGTGGRGGPGGRGGLGGIGGQGGDGGGGGAGGGGSGTTIPQGAPGGTGGAPGLGGPAGIAGFPGLGGLPGLGGSGILEILAGASFLNSGNVVVGGTRASGSGTLAIHGTLDNDGTITVHANGTLANHAGGTINNNRTIDASAARGFSNDGTLTGAGIIIGDFINEGIFTPGNSTGVHTIDGNYDERGTLNIEIGGLLTSTEYGFVDVIASNRTVSMDSATSILELSFVDGFDARKLIVGDEFDIILYSGVGSTLVGTFGSVVHPLASPVLFDLDYTVDGSLTLRVVAELPGNCAGAPAISLEDYAPMSECMTGPEGGSPPGCACADLNNDGNIDLRDFAGLELLFKD